MTTVHVVLPQGVDDPDRRSGGNVYDRRLCDGLRAVGWQVVEHEVPDAWPSLTGAAWGPLGRLLVGLDDDTVVLLDGLLACAVPELVVPLARRARVVVLVHLPLGLAPDAATTDVAEREGLVLGAASAVVTTSRWTRGWLVARYGLDEAAVHVAQPGVDPAPAVSGTHDGGRLLCVASVEPNKGHDTLLAALREVADQPWRCTCVGSLTRAPDLVEQLWR